MDQSVVAKIVSIFVILIVCLIIGNIPYIIIKRKAQYGLGPRGEFLLSLFNAFAGGVFLGACLLHLMAEGNEEMEDALKFYHDDLDYPVFQVMVAIGFFIIVFIDFTAQQCLRKSTQNSTGISFENGGKKPGSNGEVNGAYVDSNTTMSYGALNGKQENRRDTQDSNQSDPSVGIDNPVYRGGNSVAPTASANTSNTDVTATNRPDIHAHDFEQLAKTSTVSALLLTIALSFHTIFDGLAIGLQDKAQDVWQVLAAISIHKTLVSFCLGLQLFQAFTQRFRTAVICIVIFSVMSPVGIILGIIVTSTNINKAAQTMASAVLQGFASGTFLYVTFFEILKDAFAHGRSVWNIVVAIVGFTAMALVKIMDN